MFKEGTLKIPSIGESLERSFICLLLVINVMFNASAKEDGYRDTGHVEHPDSIGAEVYVTLFAGLYKDVVEDAIYDAVMLNEEDSPVFGAKVLRYEVTDKDVIVLLAEAKRLEPAKRWAVPKTAYVYRIQLNPDNSGFRNTKYLKDVMGWAKKTTEKSSPIVSVRDPERSGKDWEKFHIQGLQPLQLQRERRRGHDWAIWRPVVTAVNRRGRKQATTLGRLKSLDSR